MQNKTSLSGLWSALGLWICVSIAAHATKGFSIVVPDLLSVFKGGILAAEEGSLPFVMMVPVVLAIVSIELPCCIAGGILQSVIAGESGKHAVSELMRDLEKGNLFFKFFVLVLLEEIFARWLFLGLLAKLPPLSGTAGFIILFLAGNGLWSLFHLKNFKDDKDRKIIRVLPQFISGIFFSYAFVKFGLIGSVLAHFASNSIIFGLHKVQSADGKDLLIVAYGLLAFFVSYFFMEKPVSDVAAWLSDKPRFALEGWQFWDYVRVDVFLSSCFTIVFGLLLFDRGNAGDKSEQDSMAKLGVVGYSLALAAIIFVFYFGLFNLLGKFIDSVPYRVLALAIILAFMQPGVSGSSVSRTFWTSLPNHYLSVCIMQALGFWLSLPFVMVIIVIAYPHTILVRADD